MTTPIRLLIAAGLAGLCVLPDRLEGQQTNQEGACYGCMVVFFGGIPVGAACVSGGTTFQSCWVSGNSCSGESCGYGMNYLSPLVERYAATRKHLEALDSLVASLSSHLRWSSDGRTVQLRGCDGRWRSVARRPIGDATVISTRRYFVGSLRVDG
jgi:hypothetical protein